MTDGQIFLVVFVALYLSDCFLWASRSAIAYVSRWKGPWKPRRPGEAFGNDRGGLVFLWPLPPLGTVFVTAPWPLAFTDAGVATVTPESPNPGARVPQSDHFIRWETVEFVSVEEKWILVNDVRFLKCANPMQALAFGRRILRWRGLSPAVRNRRVAAVLRASFDHRRVARLVRLHARATRCLRALTNVLFVLCFLGVPGAYWIWHAKPPFFAVLLVVLLLMVQVTIEAFRLHRRLYPKARGDRWQHVFIQLFVPQFAMRALDPIARHRLWRFHPLAVSAVLLDRGKFETLAAAAYRDLLHPVEYHVGDAAPVAAADDFLGRQLRPAVEDFLGRERLRAESLAAPPVMVDEGARGYCPRCHAQFLIDHGVCDACGGMPARAF